MRILLLVTTKQAADLVIKLRAAGFDDIGSAIENAAEELLLGPSREALLAEAREMYEQGSDDDIEIDDDAMLSSADTGTWVQGWLWVPDDDCLKGENENENESTQTPPR